MADLENQRTNSTKPYSEHVELGPSDGLSTLPLHQRHPQHARHNIDGDLGHVSHPIDPPTNAFYQNIGNPGVLGLAAHAVTLMLLATQFMGWRGVGNPQVYIGNLYFYTGLYMFTTAHWCLIKGETFAYCVFGTFSGFYLSYAAILTPVFNVFQTYVGEVGSGLGTDDLYNSLGIFLFVWNGIFTIIFLVSLRTNLALAIVFFGVSVGVFCLGGMYFKLATATANGTSTAGAVALSKAGGAFLFISACSGFYLVIVQLSESVEMPFKLPVGDLTRFWVSRKKKL